MPWVPPSLVRPNVTLGGMGIHLNRYAIRGTSFWISGWPLWALQRGQSASLAFYAMV